MVDFRNALKQFLVAASPEAEMEKQQVQQNALALQSGQIDQSNKLNQQDIEMAKFGGQLAAALKAAPADQRASIYSQHAPRLKRNPNFDASDEAMFMSDGGLDQIIQAASFLVKPETYKLSEGEKLFNAQTNQPIATGGEKPNNWANENALREMQIRAQMDANRATRESSNAYRQSAQELQRQNMLQNQYNADRNFDLSKSRIDQQISQQNAAAQKTERVAQSKLAPLRDAVSISEQTFKQMTDLINTENFSGAVGFADQFTAPIGRALFNTKDGDLNRKAAMMTKDLAGRIIKEYGSNPSTVDLVQAMQRIPNTGDPDSVWKSWYDEVLTPATSRTKSRLQQEADALGVPTYPQPTAPQAQKGLQQFRSSTGITFEVQ